jgi:hypothetical protein
MERSDATKPVDITNRNSREMKYWMIASKNYGNNIFLKK